ncbi:hypothetical protein DITRI_Ditri02bG0185500 [Diplodiscus trichospermus]
MAGLRNAYGKRSHFQSDYAGHNGGGCNRRNAGEESEHNGIGSEDTLYRYLCHVKRLGLVVLFGKAGQVIQNISSEINARVRVLSNEHLPPFALSSNELLQIRQESGASIKVDSSGAKGDDCIIFISTKEFFEDPSPTINAAFLLQSRSSEKTERESGDSVISTRLLVPSSQVGCLTGKGGAIISEMRNATRASIRILSKENLPKVACEDEEMVQTTGGFDVASNALSQVLMRLKANIFEREGAVAGFLSVLPYIPMSLDMSDGSKHGNKDGRPRNRGYSSYSGGYSSGDLSASDSYGTYRGSLSGGDIYGSHGGCNSGEGLSNQNQVPQDSNAPSPLVAFSLLSKQLSSTNVEARHFPLSVKPA